MEYINLFIASSIVEFKEERLELGDFIRNLNDVYTPKGVYLRLFICEDSSNAIAEKRKQEEYNQQIRKCQYFYVLVGNHMGALTEEEFDVALASFQETGTPRIYTYFVKDVEVSATVLKFMLRLKHNIKHYYTFFSHIDSIKLNILLEMTRDMTLEGSISFFDGQAFVEGKAVLSLESIPVYSRNEQLKELRKHLKELNKEYQDAVAACHGNSLELNLTKKRLELDYQRVALLKQLQDLEEDILSLCSTIAHIGQDDRPATWRELMAAELVTSGDSDGALKLLRDTSRDSELEMAKKMTDEGRNRLLGYVAENHLRIQTLKAQGLTTENVAEIRDCYEECVNLDLQYALGLAIISDYCEFLEKQHQYHDGIEQAKRYLNQARKLPEETVTDLMLILGCLYETCNDYSAAESVYKKITKHIAFAELDTPSLEQVCTAFYGVYGHLARLYVRMEKSRQAWNIYSLIWQYCITFNESNQQLSPLERERYDILYADLYYDNARFFQLFEIEVESQEDFYTHKCSQTRAEKFYTLAWEAYQKLAQTDEYRFLPKLAETALDYAKYLELRYNNVAGYLLFQNKRSEADGYIQKALGQYRTEKRTKNCGV